MSLPCIPKLQWGYSLESELTLDLPLFPWSRGTSGEWGSDTAASGIPEAFVIRRDRVRWFRLRVRESEMDAFEEWLDWAQESGEPFNFWIDNEDDTTEHEVYLHSLRFEDGESNQYERSSFDPVFVIPVALRTADGSQWTTSWTDLAVATEDEES